MPTGTDARLRDLGLSLPTLPAPGANYLSARTIGSLVFLAGVISTDGSGVITGTVGAGRTIDEGYAAARACHIEELEAVEAACYTAFSNALRPEVGDPPPRNR